MLKRAEIRMPVAELTRQVGISERTFFRWKLQHAGLQSDLARELKQLLEDNAGLKSLAELSLLKEIVQKINAKKSAGLVQRRREMAAVRRESYRPRRPNHDWCIDCVADQLADGTRLRLLTIFGVFSRESIAIRVGQRLQAEDVVDECNRLVVRPGAPVRVLMDNSIEFSGRLMDL